jgi:cobaltochelatase CobS
MTEEMKIACKICGAKVHSIKLHLEKDHKDLNMTIADYEAKYPGEPILSDAAKRKLEEHARSRARGTVSAEPPKAETKVGFFHDVFGLGRVAAALGSTGKPIPVTVIADDEVFGEMVPDLDPNYVFNLDILKTLMLGLEMNIPVYLWGHSGTGKTTIFEQIAARTNRPMLRVQHTANMEEEHIIGGWRLRDGRTVFDLGPLPMAMKFGWLYLADEYDFGRPEVTSAYQAVLEGKPLVIKEADADNRVIRPHPNFRIIATGNTNGQGDESGLYQGTTLQNAANYERFGIVEQMPYMDKKLEERLVSQQADVPLDDARKIVDFATRIRAEFDAAKIGNPISPRSLIYAARIGIIRNNYRIGLEKAYINRLSTVDREAAAQVAQRVFAA